MEREFAKFRAGLERLRKAAVSLDVFGSESHRFKTYPTLTERRVTMFESRHRIALPPEYRGFLIHVGNGGAGPAYGLFKLGEMDDGPKHKAWTEDGGFVGVLSKPFPHRCRWNDLSKQPKYDASRENDQSWEDDYNRRMDAWEDRVYWNTANVNGAVPICHLGCALRQWLVVTGPEAGNVWDDLRADCEGLKPFTQPKRKRVTFLQWYQSWLSSALRRLP